MSVEKRAIRREMRERRKALPAYVVEAAGAAVYLRLRALAAYAAAVSVIAYIADENEIPTAEVIQAVIRSQRLLFLPRASPAPSLARWDPGDPLVAGEGGVREPLAGPPSTVDGPAIGLLPVVAWDTCGTRLGRGGGFYDRLFAGLDAAVVRVGLAYEFQQFPELPRDEWDISLDYVITERRTITCRANAVGGQALQKGGLQQ
jgi:5-formyltetrahydrofolate cyclo-ligase